MGYFNIDDFGLIIDGRGVVTAVTGDLVGRPVGLLDVGVFVGEDVGRGDGCFVGCLEGCDDGGAESAKLFVGRKE